MRNVSYSEFRGMILAVCAAISMLCASLLSSCSNDADGIVDDTATANVSFAVKGDFTFSQTPFENGTRAGLEADGKSMTDLWVFDVVDGTVNNTIHQQSGDDGFGTVSMKMTKGTHKVCFVASRGSNATVDNEAHTVKWTSVSDTFWQTMDVTVDGSAASHEVTLDRVVARLKFEVTDEVPSAISKLNVNIAKFYYGLNYLTGAATGGKELEVAMSVPDNMKGTTGNFIVSFFSISDATEWTTDVTLGATDADGNSLGSVSISSVPLLRNRSTNYKGTLFSASSPFALTLSDTWTSYDAEW